MSSPLSVIFKRARADAERGAGAERDPGDVRTVAEHVLRGREGIGRVVVKADHATREVGVGRVDAAVDDRDVDRRRAIQASRSRQSRWPTPFADARALRRLVEVRNDEPLGLDAESDLGPRAFFAASILRAVDRAGEAVGDRLEDVANGAAGGDESGRRIGGHRAREHGLDRDAVADAVNRGRVGVDEVVDAIAVAVHRRNVRHLRRNHLRDSGRGNRRRARASSGNYERSANPKRSSKHSASLRDGLPRHARICEAIGYARAMVATTRSPEKMSYEGFLVFEAASEEKHEWVDGVVYAMTRGTPEHARLAMKFAMRALGDIDDCEAFTSDMPIFIEAGKHHTYADASIVCNEMLTKQGLRS